MKSLLLAFASLMLVFALSGAARAEDAKDAPKDGKGSVTVTENPKDPVEKEDRSKTQPKEDGHDNGEGNDDKTK